MSSRPSLDKYYTDMLDLVASRSTCIRRAVGAIVVDNKGRLVSIGYNGVPSSMRHCIDHPCPGAGDQPGDNTKCQAIHAEQNALLRAGVAQGLHSIYTSTTPCFNCAKLIVSSGIRHVISKTFYADVNGINLLHEAGIGIMMWDEMLQKCVPLSDDPMYYELAHSPAPDRVRIAFDLIAKANTVSILSLGEMEAIVNRSMAGEFDRTR